MESQIQENKMGIMPVNRLLITMSLPMIISMLVQAMYNVVDSIFVARISEDALTAVSMAFPVQNLMIAFGSGTGVGINALLSKSLGEKNFKEADNAANNGVFISILHYFIFLLFGIFLTRWFFTAQTNITAIADYGSDYLSICCIFSFGVIGQIIFERLLQSTGKTVYAMIIQIVGAVVNLILDPVMIFGLFGFPPMGVKGAAAATVIGQITALMLGIWFNIKRNSEIKLKVRGFRPNAKTIKRIYAVGLPSIVTLSVTSVMGYCMNNILLVFSSTATAVFGIYYRLQSFVILPVVGLNNGMVPILAYNYGAQKKDRMIKVIKLGICYAMGIMLLGVAVLQIFPGGLLSVFDASKEMLEIGVIALRIAGTSFLFTGFCIMCGSAIQALGNGVLSMVISIARQLGALVPIAYFMSLTGNLNLVWLSFPLAEIVSVTLSGIFIRHIYKKVIKPIP